MSIYQPKKYLIKTYGCQASMADSSTMAGILESLGFEKASNLDESDIFIINTCSVRQKSEDKTYGLGKEIKRISENGQKIPFTIMAGCMVGSVTGERQRYEFDLLKQKTPWVNEYINPAQLLNIPQILSDNNLIDEWAQKKFNPDEIYNQSQTSDHAFVNISFGCDNFCTFCVVPYARGKEISRSKEEILREIKHFGIRGVKKITLCGQNVNSWGLDMYTKFEIRSGSDFKLPFAQLLREIHELEEIEKIDFISSNPFDFTSDLIDVFKLPKISNYLHIAVQSGNDEILKKMNRRHTAEEFKILIKRIRDIKPELEIGTDIIVGFPSETFEQFEDTVSLIEEMKFNVAFISIYSPRKGTPAEKYYTDDVPLNEKKRRHAILTEVFERNKPAR